MPAKKRHVSVGFVENSTANIRVEMFYDTREHVFYGKYAEELYQTSDQNALEKVIRQAIVESLTMPWQSVIHVRVMRPSYARDEDSFLGFEIERMWMTKMENSGWKQAQWSAAEHGNYLAACRSFSWNDEKDGPFIVPTSRKHYGDIDYYHPYSDELWEQLQQMQAGLRAMRALFLSLFENQADLRLLLPGIVRALPAPKEIVSEQ